jgi:IS1 family transposase
VEAPDLASRCSPRLAKAIYHAIKDKWSAVALIERHRAHKSSNVADVLAEHHHAWVRRELARAFANPEVERPKR